MRNFKILRQDAEALVDLLEECDPKLWRNFITPKLELAAELREEFGMSTREESLMVRNAYSAR